jgi:DNA topoisomerase-1
LIVDACRNQDGKVAEVKTQDIEIKAPNPFNLGDLQKEAYRTLKFSPSNTLAIAEKLYLSALISYPRTSSQKLPSSINFKKIISELSKIDSHFAVFADNSKGSKTNGDSYADMAIKLLSRNSLSPNEGNKTDPAHPAIYPTGEKPKVKLENAELKLFDLIVKRFFATFGDPALNRQTVLTIIVKDSHIFKAKGKKLLHEGWMYFYKPYVTTTSMAETSTALPMLYKDDMLKCVEMTLTGKFTQPPFRFNESSLLEEMEKEKIGTKSTRSEIINTLFRRNYVINSISTFKKEDTNDMVSRTGIEPTDLGFKIIQSLRKYAPHVVSTDLTRSMEEQLEEIELGKAKSEFVVDFAKNKLNEAIVFFKQNQKDIGVQISNAVITTGNSQQVILGTCPICSKGNLIIKRSNKTKKRFVGCSEYSSIRCIATAPLPQKGTIKSTGKTCTECGWPLIKCIYSNPAKHLWRFCINMQCTSKDNHANNSQSLPSQQN